MQEQLHQLLGKLHLQGMHQTLERILAQADAKALPPA